MHTQLPAALKSRYDSLTPDIQDMVDTAIALNVHLGLSASLAIVDIQASLTDELSGEVSAPGPEHAAIMQPFIAEYEAKITTLKEAAGITTGYASSYPVKTPTESMVFHKYWISTEFMKACTRLQCDIMYNTACDYARALDNISVEFIAGHIAWLKGRCERYSIGDAPVHWHDKINDLYAKKWQEFSQRQWVERNHKIIDEMFGNFIADKENYLRERP